MSLYKAIRITLVFFEKIISVAGAILMLIFNSFLFARNKQIINHEWFWAAVTSGILLLMLYLHGKDLVVSLKDSVVTKATPKSTVFINLALVAIMVVSFFEMVIFEYFEPVGGYEKVFFSLMAGMLCYMVKLVVDSMKLLLGGKNLRFVKWYCYLLISFFIFHGLWIVTQNNFRYIKQKNRISIASVIAGDLSAGEKFLGHKAYILGSTIAPYGYLIYEPEEIHRKEKLPLLIFLHGGDELGNSRIENHILSRAAKHGPSRYIKNGHWRPPVLMFVVSPQTTDGWWKPEMVHEFIEYLLATYPIDKSRIYLTGLSRGGTGSFDYVNQYGDASYVAAMLPLATDAFVVHSGKFTPENFKNIPLWLFINDKDKYVADYKATAQIIEAIKIYNDKAKVTVYPRHGHDAWTQTYTMTGQGFERPEYDSFNVDIFKWL